MISCLRKWKKSLNSCFFTFTFLAIETFYFRASLTWNLCMMHGYYIAAAETALLFVYQVFFYSSSFVFFPPLRSTFHLSLFYEYTPFFYSCTFSLPFSLFYYFLFSSSFLCLTWHLQFSLSLLLYCLKNFPFHCQFGLKKWKRTGGFSEGREGREAAAVFVWMQRRKFRETCSNRLRRKPESNEIIFPRGNFFRLDGFFSLTFWANTSSLRRVRS